MSRKLFFGVDVGGTFTKAALVDGRSRLIAKARFSSEGFSDKSFFAKTLKSNLGDILARCGFSFANVGGLGIGVPGPVDFNRGIVLSLTNIRGWDRFPLSAFLKKYFSASILVENDANCMALAEARLGAARGASSALCVTLGTGVGGGLILDGRIYHSPYFLGGEIGHVPVSAEGPECQCGGRGCLERFVGNRALLKKARALFKREISLEEVSLLAGKRNAKALAFWGETGNLLGMAIAGVVNVFNPEIVVVGGGVADAGGALLGAIRQAVQGHAMKQLKTKVKIKKAALGNDAGILGAALLAKERAETT